MVTNNDLNNSIRVDFEMDMARAHEKVFEFVTAVKNSGFNLECFVDKVQR